MWHASMGMTPISKAALAAAQPYHTQKCSDITRMCLQANPIQGNPNRQPLPQNTGLPCHVKVLVTTAAQTLRCQGGQVQRSIPETLPWPHTRTSDKAAAAPARQSSFSCMGTLLPLPLLLSADTGSWTRTKPGSPGTLLPGTHC